MGLRSMRSSAIALVRQGRAPWNVRWMLIALLVVAMLPALAVGYVLLRSGLNQAAESSRDEAIRSTVAERRLVSAALSTHLANVGTTLRAAASFGAVQRLDRAASSDVLNVFTRSNPSLSRIDLIDASGASLLSSSSGITSAPWSAAEGNESRGLPPHLYESLRGKTMVTATFDGPYEEQALLVAVPIFAGAEGSVVGVLQTRLSLIDLANVLSRVVLESDTAIVNRVTGDPFVSVTRRPSPIEHLIALSDLPDTDQDRPERVSGVSPLWVSRTTIPETPLLIIGATPERPPVQIPALLLTMAYFAVGPACIGLLAVYISHRLLSPVVTLTQTARAVTAGEYDRRASIQSRMVEVNEIGAAFDEMLDELAVQRDELTRSREQIRELLQRTFLVQEEERQRIALDLHDRVVQLLIGALYELQSIAERSRSQPASEQSIVRAIAALRLAEGELRRVIFDVRPPLPSPGGLSAAIQAFMDDQRERFESCSFVEQGASPRLTERTSNAAYRVVQEAIRNAGKHAPGSRLEVVMSTQRDWLEIRISDDGPGIHSSGAAESSALHLGIIGMRERAQAAAGSLSIRSRRTRVGTSVVLRLPLDQEQSTNVGTLQQSRTPTSAADELQGSHTSSRSAPPWRVGMQGVPEKV